MRTASDELLDWLEHWSEHRKVEDAAILAFCPDDAPKEFFNELKWFAEWRGLNFLENRGSSESVISLGGVMPHVISMAPREAFLAIAEEARRENLALAGHIPLGLTAEQVIDAGQRDIEHLSNLALWRPCSGGQKYSPEACRPFFEMLARRGVWSTPTLVAMSEIATIGTPASAVSADRLVYASKSLRAMWAGNQSISTPGAAQFLKANAEVAAVVTKDMANVGVGILAGCDSMIAGFCVHDELAAMVHGGMTPLAALQTATLNTARYFGLQRTAGSVASGHSADLVLLDASPLADITNVGRIRAVVVAGRFLDRTELDKLLAQVKIATAQ